MLPIEAKRKELDALERAEGLPKPEDRAYFEGKAATYAEFWEYLEFGVAGAPSPQVYNTRNAQHCQELSQQTTKE